MLPFHPNVASIIHTLLCDNDEKQSACCYLSQTFWKPAKAGEGTAWHQDNGYFFIKRYWKGCGVWIPVDDAYIENGTLQLCDAPADILDHEREPNSDHHIPVKIIWTKVPQPL
eukprot:UN28074